MSKNHLSKQDIEKLIIHLRNYDNYICQKLRKPDNEETDHLIEIHDSIDYLIQLLKR